MTPAEEIYKLYPRKVGKPIALKKIEKAIKEVGFDELKKRVLAYAGATSRWDEEDRRFIPYPATWFNQGRYDDDPREWERDNGGFNPANRADWIGVFKFIHPYDPEPADWSEVLPEDKAKIQKIISSRNRK